MTKILRGACYCGKVEVSFETAAPPADLQLRACQCSFCRSHGAKTVTDANGSLTISARANDLVRYRFGQRTADFLLCRTCGVYVAAAIEEGGEQRATLNAAGMMIDGLRDRTAVAVSFEREDAEARRRRRLANWTPARIVEPAAAVA